MGWWVAVVGRAGWLPWYLWRRESSLLSAHPGPVPLEAAHKTHMSQSAASSTKRLLGARRDQGCARLFVLQWGGGVVSFKGLGGSDGGRVVGHTTIYPIQLAPASKTSDCESLQVAILKVNQKLLLWSDVTRRSLREPKQELERIELGSWEDAIAQSMLLWNIWVLQCSPMVFCGNHPESCFEIVVPGNILCGNYPESWQLFLDSVILDNPSTRSLNQPIYITRYLELHKESYEFE